MNAMSDSSETVNRVMSQQKNDKNIDNSDNSDNADNADKEYQIVNSPSKTIDKKMHHLQQRFMNGPREPTRPSSQIDNNGKKQEEKKVKKHPLGLSAFCNLGNTCYMNSGLQALLGTKALMSYFLTTNDKSAKYYQDLVDNVITSLMKEKKCEREMISDKEKREKFKESLTYKFRNLCVMKYFENCRIKPKSFKNSLGTYNEIFEGYRQHDSQECVSSILDIIHEETKTDVDIRFVGMTKEYDE